MEIFVKLKKVSFVFLIILSSTLLHSAAPTVPVLYSPSTATWTNVNMFDWSSSTTTTGDAIFYDIAVDNAEDFATVVSSAYNIYRSSCLISELDNTLSENTQYWWHVRASTSTSGEYSAWSSTRTFKLDTTDAVFSNMLVKTSTGGWAANTVYVNVSTPQIRINVQDVNSGLSVGQTETLASSGCVLLMHLNGNANDSSGYGNDGTITGAAWTNTPTWKSVGGSESILFFDGNGDYVDCGNNESLDVTTEFTLSAWINPTDVVGYNGIIGRKPGYSSYYGYAMGHEGDGIHVNVGGGTNSGPAYSIGGNIKAGIWQMVTATYKSGNYGGGKYGKIDYYYNGSWFDYDLIVTSSIVSGTDKLGIGCGDATNRPYIFQGYLDEAGVWNRALSAEEIAVMYNSCAVKYSTNAWTSSAIITSTDTMFTTGTDGTTAIQFSTATEVPLKNGTDNRIQFLARDAAGNLSESASYTINVDTVAPSDITTLAGSSIDNISNIDAHLSWLAPGSDAQTGTINDGQFKIRRATWSVTPESMWGTGYDAKPAVIEQEVTIDTTSVTPLSYQTTTFYTLANNTSHYFRIWTRDIVGNWSNISNGCTVYLSPPPPPGSFSGVALSTYSIQWSWTDVAGETGYRVRYSTKASPSDAPASPSLPTNQITWTESGLMANTSYYRVVVSTNSQGESGLSNAATTYTLASPPLVPIVFSNVGQSSATLTWTASTDNPAWTRYGVITSTSSDFAGTAVSTTVAFADNLTTNTKSVISLGTDTTYYFRILAYNESQIQTASIESSTKTKEGIPDRPRNLKISALLGTTSIYWQFDDNSTNETELYVSSNMDITARLSTNLANTASKGTTYWLELGLSTNTLYTRYVEATNIYGSTWSVVITSYTMAAAPLNITFSNVGFSSVTVPIQWDANTNPAGTRFGVSRSANSTFSATVSTFVVYSNNLTTNSTTATGLTASTTYYFRVWAYNGNQTTTLYTTSVSTITNEAPPNKPSNLKISTSTSLGTTSIYWQFDDNSTNETGLYISSGTNIAGRLSTNLANTATTGTTYWLEIGLSTNTSYTRYAEAINASGYSVWSTLITSYTAADVPSNLTFPNVYTSSATLTWSASTNPTGTRYGIITSSSSDFYGASISTTVTYANNLTANTTPVTSLIAETTYYFRVIAFNGNQIQTSSFVQSSTMTKSGAYIPNLPKNLKIVSFGTTSIYWQFDDNSTNETGLYLSSGTNITMRLSSNLANTATTGTTYWLEIGLSTNTAYTRYAEAYTLAGSSWSVAITSYTAAAVPSSITFSNIGTSSATLTWSANNNPNTTRYAVERSSDNIVWDWKQLLADNLTAVTYIDSTLVPNTTFYYRVTAYNGNGTATSASTIYNVCTKADIEPPAAPVITITLSNAQTTIKTGDKMTLTGTAELGSSIYSITIKDLDGNILAQWIDPESLTSDTINNITLKSASSSSNGTVDIITSSITLGNIAAKFPMVGGITIGIVVQDSAGNKSQTGTSDAIMLSAETNKITLYNNLFNPVKGDKMTIRYETVQPGKITIDVYTLNGDKVTTLVNETTTSSVPHWATWDGKDDNGSFVASDIYLIYIKGPGLKDTKKVCVIK
ncbi:MAG: fibronectin type III domain-containing protein [Elusimicrobia bacterium]|nr:fibronectin type III domain-containing protein [Elusimicrobiota bacterium]